jgi:flagellar biosynthesis component FlhA
MLRERPEVAYLVVAAIYLLLVVWSPIPAMRRPLFLLILAVLLGFGVWILRRQTEAEFPEEEEEDEEAATEITSAGGPDAGT